MKTITATSGRVFAAFPVAVMAFVINGNEEFLLFKRPGRCAWEPPSGALEHGETPCQGLVRELREELGADFSCRVIGPVSATTFRFDDRVPSMISLGFAVEHLGGHILPGDDMSDAEVGWMSLENILNRSDIAVPEDVNLFSEALHTFRARTSAGGRGPVKI